MTETICPICQRPHGEIMQDHHLKPRTFRNRDKHVKEQDNLITIHKICHSAIHAFFTEKELYDYYHTPERLMENEQMQKFVKWVGKKDLDFYQKMKWSNRRR